MTSRIGVDFTKKRPASIATSTTSSWWLGLAAVATLLSLGLPWRPSSIGLTLGWGYQFNVCWSWEYTCVGSFGPTTTLEYVAGVQGSQHPARVMIALAIGCAWWGYRKSRASLKRLAVLAGAAGALAFGLGSGSGQIALIIGVIAFMAALRSDGISLLPPAINPPAAKSPEVPRGSAQ